MSPDPNSEEESLRRLTRLTEIQQKPENERTAEEIQDLKSLVLEQMQCQIKQDPEAFRQVAEFMLNGGKLDFSKPTHSFFPKETPGPTGAQAIKKWFFGLFKKKDS